MATPSAFEPTHALLAPPPHGRVVGTARGRDKGGGCIMGSFVVDRAVEEEGMAEEDTGLGRSAGCGWDGWLMRACRGKAHHGKARSRKARRQKGTSLKGADADEA